VEINYETEVEEFFSIEKSGSGWHFQHRRNGGTSMYVLKEPILNGITPKQ
jgi:hypothetical protein